MINSLTSLVDQPLANWVFSIPDWGVTPSQLGSYAARSNNFVIELGASFGAARRYIIK